MIGLVRPVGFYSELDERNPSLYVGSIADAIRDSASANEAEIVRYLESGITLIDIMEAGKDVISGDEYVTGCSSVLTDGTWIWRLDLPYYVNRYHLSLDSDFLDHLAKLGYVMPQLEREQVIPIARDVIFNVLGMR